MQGNKENISYEFRLTKFGKLGKSVLIENELGDFGERMYDYEIGRLK